MLFLFQVPPFKKAFTETMPYVDFLFGNESEAEAFAESEGWKTKNITEIAGKVCCATQPCLPSQHQVLLHVRNKQLSAARKTLMNCCWLQIASQPKENGARGRTVVITQGALPTVVASQGKVSNHACCTSISYQKHSTECAANGHGVPMLVWLPCLRSLDCGVWKEAEQQHAYGNSFNHACYWSRSCCLQRLHCFDFETERHVTADP